MSVLVASYDGVMQFNAEAKAPQHFYAKQLNSWQEITLSNIKHGDLIRAKQAFEVAAAYGRLTLQKVRGL
ncbi:hypothetical protein FLM48_11105 [Shewanella sp. Scap07]|uniref:hypothetical protein n=1 Tax=Shewanella sp. Scap07 TaxID=2589987 RepID=UPI0015BBF01A|nr:hypothetical protein [Shewanella sp. Scap07]QLE85577.1 hypothetical protein FLM48_11105 [Shewanella sp. Scap07]